jgi:hypothetical protein
MKILIACEFSGVVRDAFRDCGHDAWSCDLLPTDRPGQHIQGNVLEIINDGWDMMIAHPPCTYLTNAGIAHFNVYKYGQKAIDRWYKRIESLEFFMELINAPIEKICVENPVGFPNTAYRKPDQIIHPYYFGERQMKRTCLWLKNLPNLWYWLEPDLFGEQTVSEKPEPISIDNSPRQKKRYFTDAIIGYSNNHGHERSKTFKSIAEAMADQWGNL